MNSDSLLVLGKCPRPPSPPALNKSPDPIWCTDSSSSPSSSPSTCSYLEAVYIFSSPPLQAPALRRARHLERGGGTDAPQAFRRGELVGRVWFDPRSFFSWDGRQVTRVSSYVRRPFPSKETRRISERHDPGPPVVPGGQGIGLGSRTLERAGR
jgi:hypothetical protein